ncbi:MAG: hypothetical protein ABL888_02920 [Pirellulaceae bacterium]
MMSAILAAGFGRLAVNFLKPVFNSPSRAVDGALRDSEAKDLNLIVSSWSIRIRVPSEPPISAQNIPLTAARQMFDIYRQRHAERKSELLAFLNEVSTAAIQMSGVRGMSLQACVHTLELET